MTKYYVDVIGNYLGGFDGAEPPIDSIEVAFPPADAREIWDGAVWTLPLEIKRENVLSAIKQAYQDTCVLGIVWKFNPGSTAYIIPFNATNESFLSANERLIEKSAVDSDLANPHGGFWLPSGASAQFAIDDSGLAEIADFMGMWILKMSRIRLVETEDMLIANETALDAYDAGAIDWSSTWSKVGWSNNTLTQTP